MRHTVLIQKLLLALLWTSCLRDEISDYSGFPTKSEADTYISTRLVLGLSVGETIRVTTIRVVIFTAAGEYITHRVHRFPNGGSVFTYDNGIIIDGSDFLSIPTVSGQSEVFVIVNEDVSPALSIALDGTKTASSPMQYLQTMLSKPIEYERLLDEEPPFIMFVRGSFNVAEGYRFDDPFVLNFTNIPSSGSECRLHPPVQLVRSMAKVTITGITSEMMCGEIDDRCNDIMKEVSRIFVLDMGLKNVPTQFWISPNWTDVPSFRNFSFGADAVFAEDNIPYFSRSWEGDMSITILADGRVRQTQRLRDGRLWWDGRTAGVGAFSFDRAIMDRAVNAANNMNGFRDAARATIAQRNNPTFVPIFPDYNEGNFFVLYSSGLNRPINPDDFLPPTFEFLNAGDKVLVNVTGDNWELNTENLSFYIPEHLLANTGNATSLYITATRASLPTVIKGYEICFDADVTWDTNWQHSQSSGGQVIAGGGGITREMLERAWGWEFDEIQDARGVTHIVVRHYFDLGLLRWRDGTFTRRIDITRDDDPDIDFKVTPKDQAEAVTFVIPIADDFRTHRNHEYRFSIHATHPWWGSGTRSANGVVPFRLQRVE